MRSLNSGGEGFFCNLKSGTRNFLFQNLKNGRKEIFETLKCGGNEFLQILKVRFETFWGPMHLENPDQIPHISFPSIIYQIVPTLV